MKDLEYYREHLDDLVIRTTCAEEQETVIVIPRKGATQLSTSDNMMLTKMRRVLKDPDTAWRLVDVSVTVNETDPWAVTELAFETDEKLVAIRPAKRTRELTDEQRAAIVERFRKQGETDRFATYP